MLTKMWVFDDLGVQNHLQHETELNTSKTGLRHLLYLHPYGRFLKHIKINYMFFLLTKFLLDQQHSICLDP